MNNRKDKQIYWKGDLAEYTGKSEILHGGLFHEYLLLEGHRKGEKIWSPRACEIYLANPPSIC
jgi:hypothetical protein